MWLFSELKYKIVWIYVKGIDVRTLKQCNVTNIRTSQEAYISMMHFFHEIVNAKRHQLILRKSFIIDLWLGSKHGFPHCGLTNGTEWMNEWMSEWINRWMNEVSIYSRIKLHKNTLHFWTWSYQTFLIIICRLVMFNTGAIRFGFKITFKGKCVFHEARVNITDLFTSFYCKVSNLLISKMVVFFFFNKVA